MFHDQKVTSDSFAESAKQLERASWFQKALMCVGLVGFRYRIFRTRIRNNQVFDGIPEKWLEVVKCTVTRFGKTRRSTLEFVFRERQGGDETTTPSAHFGSTGRFSSCGKGIIGFGV